MSAQGPKRKFMVYCGNTPFESTATPASATKQQSPSIEGGVPRSQRAVTQERGREARRALGRERLSSTQAPRVIGTPASRP